MQHQGQDADHDHRDEALEQGRQQRQNEPAPQRTFVGEQVGGHDSLAVAGSRRVKHAIGEAEAKQQPQGRAVGVQGPDGGRELALEHHLLLDDPADEAA